MQRDEDDKRTSDNPKNRLASHLEDTSSLVIKTNMEDTEFITLRRYLNCFDQEDPQLIDALKEHYIRYQDLMKNECSRQVQIESSIIGAKSNIVMYLGTLTMQCLTTRMKILMELERMPELHNTGKMKYWTPSCFKGI